MASPPATDTSDVQPLPRGFARLIFTQFVSGLADHALLVIAFALLMHQGADPWWAAMLKFSFTLAYVLLAPWVGIWADRRPKAQVMGSSFKRANAQGSFTVVDDATKASIVTALAAVPAVKVLEPNAAAASVLSGFSSQVAAKRAEILGTVTETLCLVRDPGEGTNRSSTVPGCEGANLKARGSDVTQVVAEAFLAGSLRADVSIQNAGGVRIALAARQISFNDALTVLPFSNVLVELNMTGTQIKAVLEDALSNHLDNGGSTGSHPYAAGLRWDLDMSQPKGSRISNLELRNRATGQWSAIDSARSYVVVTNDFIASGQDGYATFGALFKASQFVNTYLLYSQTFVDYIKAKGNVARVARSDYAHKSVITKAGVRLAE